MEEKGPRQLNVGETDWTICKVCLVERSWGAAGGGRQILITCSRGVLPRLMPLPCVRSCVTSTVWCLIGVNLLLTSLTTTITTRSFSSPSTPPPFPVLHHYYTDISVACCTSHCTSSACLQELILKYNGDSCYFSITTFTIRVGWARRQELHGTGEAIHRLPLGRRAATSSRHLLTGGRQGGHKLVQAVSLPLTA
ncbi:hypothetical protein E2C01_057265 [Portunus trituberculatus]|uniref:Uncharacterized protein n=1 Tax=Portunus trituberculatus TaxID=210409 RepID=A0A5B7GSH5_PORTR|nr:hypothetical protein [Portunus trituberculatus]